MSRFPRAVQEVNAILTEYVNINDDIFGFSWRKVIPIPGIFKALDYAGYHRQLGLLDGQLSAILNSPVSDDLPSVFPLYVDALLRTIRALHNLCERLLEKSKGGDYPMGQYRAAVAAYESLVREYCDLGERLNRELGIT
jgi:hypothetical protein